MYCLNTSSIDVGKLTRYVMKINSVTSLVYPSLTCIYILYIHCTTCMSNLICTNTNVVLNCPPPESLIRGGLLYIHRREIWPYKRVAFGGNGLIRGGLLYIHRREIWPYMNIQSSPSYKTIPTKGHSLIRPDFTSMNIQ
jgi:hypothetical protein